MNGCHNRPPFKESLWVFNGYGYDATRREIESVKIPFRMAMDCQYSKSKEGQVDPKCEGCTHKK